MSYISTLNVHQELREVRVNQNKAMIYLERGKPGQLFPAPIFHSSIQKPHTNRQPKTSANYDARFHRVFNLHGLAEPSYAAFTCKCQETIRSLGKSNPSLFQRYFRLPTQRTSTAFLVHLGHSSA